ncbi:MAG: hypothetical protein ACO1OB_08610, partial [Archangium sp.]
VGVASGFSFDDARHKRTTVRLVRLVLDRNGIKRMSELAPETVVNETEPSRERLAASAPVSVTH